MKMVFALSLALAAAVLGAAPAPVRADPASHCPEGCYVVTCVGNICSVWRCGTQGCRLIATLPGVQPRAVPGNPGGSRG